ncbi:hypothetical protein Zm00014a_042063 [Zea mays]|jgi:hypothetical protein
MNISH